MQLESNRACGSQMAGVVAQLASDGGCRYNGSWHTTHTPSDTVFVTGTIIIRPSLLEVELPSGSTKPHSRRGETPRLIAGWCTQDLLGYGDSLRGGRQVRVLPQPAGRSRFCILGDASPETRPVGAEL